MSRLSHPVWWVLAAVLLLPPIALGQFFPPRQPSAPGSAAPLPQQPLPPPMTVPQAPPQGPPAVGGFGSLQGQMRTIPFGALMGNDFTKSFVEVSNLRSPMDSHFVLSPGLQGRFMVDKHEVNMMNGNRAYFHLSGLSNPPAVTTIGTELRFQFGFPAITVKGYYKDYSPAGDSAMPDLTIEKAEIEIYLTPGVNQQGLPIYQSARVVFIGSLRQPESCGVWFDVIFRINVCDAVNTYLNQVKPAIQEGVRDALQHQQTRTQFDQTTWSYLRAMLLNIPGFPPLPPQTQFQILDARFQGTDYAVRYLPH